MLRLMLIDDEPLALRGLKAMLARQPAVSVVAEADSAEAALSLIPGVRPDALFLDIRMPEADGFQLLSSLEHAMPVVFVTAHSEYAVRAFEVQAVDYLLKPVSPERLGQAVRRLQAACGAETDEKNPYGMSDRICLRTPERTVVAPLADVLLLQADKDFTRVSVAGVAPILICQALGVYERNLPGPPFLRVDRSTMLNLSRIQSVEISPSRGARVFLHGLEHPVPLGRAALRRLRRAIPQFLANVPGLE